MRWTEAFYNGVFSKYGEFSLREHDYTFNNCKFGGNAQAITSKRWLHHTSFLWDYESKNMLALKNPAKQPKYREKREHGQFLVPLKGIVDSREQLLQDLQDNAAAHFKLQEASYEEASEALKRNHLRGNRIIDFSQYMEDT
eukprot:GHRR01015029.1.p1 GENE.GHRR01015029.1~~GHRR01015029.1.p1  ORF type:complete len:141 (+),score=44.78 GHRR01015029.1:112-534(+)